MRLALVTGVVVALGYAVELRRALSLWGGIAVVCGALLAGAIAGLLAWFVAGRVLRPVGELERHLRALPPGDPTARVPESPGDDEVSGLARGVNDALGRLQESSENRLRSVAGTLRALEGPIDSVRADLDEAAAHPDRVDPVVAIRSALVGVERLRELAADAQLLARLRAGERPRRELLPWFEVMNGVRVPSDVAVTVGGDLATLVLGARAQLILVTQYLLDEAAQHARSAVAVRIAAFDGAVVLRVDDDGPTRTPADRERDLASVAGDGPHDDPDGARLRMVLVDEIVRAHGGEVRIEESPHGGTRLRVELPAPVPIP